MAGPVQDGAVDCEGLAEHLQGQAGVPPGQGETAPVVEKRALEFRSGGQGLGPGEKNLGRGRIILVQIKTGPLEVNPPQGLGGPGLPGRVLGRQQVLGGFPGLALLGGHGGQVGLVDAGRGKLLPFLVQVVGQGKEVPGLRIIALLQGHGPQVVELLRRSRRKSTDRLMVRAREKFREARFRSPWGI